MSNFPQTKSEFEEYKKALESKGFAVLTKWRKGIKTIRLGDIVLTPNQETEDERMPKLRNDL